MTELIPMTGREREELAKVVRLNAKVARAAVAQREAELLADVEAQLAAKYESTDEAWAEITAETRRLVKQADEQIAARCRELGIREEFRPGLSLGWHGRGVNGEAERRGELRRVATTQIAAAGAKAKATIEAKAAELLTELVAGGLLSTEAKEWLARLPTPVQLMPTLSVAALEVTEAAQRARRRSLY